MKWARDTAPVNVVHVRSFEEASGRLVYATSSLELLWPFFTPLCAFTSSSPADSVRAVPPYVAFFRRFIARSVERERHSQYAATSREEELAPLVDAQESDLRTVVCGWLLAIGVDGNPDPLVSPWSAGEVREEDFLRVFSGEGNASRAIATLEALAMLLAVRGKIGEDSSLDRPFLHRQTGNGALLNKLKTSKCPTPSIHDGVQRAVTSSDCECFLSNQPGACWKKVLNVGAGR